MKKLLIITQKVDKNDPILGFFHAWIAEFARIVPVSVICLEEGEHDLPDVAIYSLGKDPNVKHWVFDIADRFVYLVRLKWFLFRLHGKYDTVFVHMNPIYIVLAGWWWRLTGKRIALWYTHRQVDWKLRIATRLSHIVFSAALESFRIKTPKLHVVGHGIDVDRFDAAASVAPEDDLRITHIGRITRIKNIDVLIEAARILKEEWGKNFYMALVGGTVTDADLDYLEEMKRRVSQYRLKSQIQFVGSVNPEEIPGWLARSDVTVNLTPTGGLDKAVLESMAAGVPAFSSNEAFRDYFGAYAPHLLFEENNPRDLADKIMHFFATQNYTEAAHELQNTARERASIGALITRIVEKL